MNDYLKAALYFLAGLSAVALGIFLIWITEGLIIIAAIALGFSGLVYFGILEEVKRSSRKKQRDKEVLKRRMPGRYLP